MNWLRELMRRVRFRISGRQFDQDLAEEMRLHIELRAAAKRESGLNMSEAETAARRQFGNVTRLQEISREAWGWAVLDAIWQDVGYAVRALASNRAFAAAAVLSLTLGIGANTAIFSIINASMLRSLPVEDPQRLVQIKMGRNPDLTNPMFEEFRRHQRLFSGMFAYATGRFDLADGGESRPANGIWVTGDFFRTLGVPAMRGRLITPEDDQRGGGPAGPVAVISHAFWQRNFQSDPEVVGKTLRLNRQTFEIVGVTPPWFTGLHNDRGFDVAIPLGCEPVLNPGSDALNNPAVWWLWIIGRVQEGSSIQQASDHVRSIAPEILRATVPRFFEPHVQKQYLEGSFQAEAIATGFSELGSRYKDALLMLMGIAGAVLLIACANIANLLLARAASRQRELSVRMAIGASRWRVMRQLITESLVLALLGTCGGVLVASWGGRFLLSMLSTAGNRMEVDLSLDVRLFAFMVTVAFVTALLIGLVPAFRATRVALNSTLKENARGAVEGSSRFRLGQALVAAQMAMSLVLVLGAGLFLGSFRNLLHVDTGFDRNNVLLIHADARQAAIPGGQLEQKYSDILERFRSIPGVISAATCIITPISGMGWNQPLEPEGVPLPSERDALVFMNQVSPDYFRTLNAQIVVGRDFRDSDDAGAPKVIIIGEATARQFFGSNNPVGRRLGMKPHGSSRQMYEIVGVVKDMKYARIQEGLRRTAYLPARQDTEPRRQISYAVRYAGSLEAIAPAIRSAVAGVNNGISLELRQLDAQIQESLLQPRIIALLSSAFGLLALLLAMLGLYGTTAYSTSRRRSEIGIRMALGAQRPSVVWLVLRDVALLLAVGLAAGMAASLALGRLLTAMLFGVRPDDPAHLAGSAAILVAAATIAAFLPALQASRLDPMIALREE